MAYKLQLKTLFVRTKTYFRDNLELLPIFVFQVLLVGSAGLLFINQTALSENISVVAYFLLVLGVILTLIKLKAGPIFE